MKRGNKMTLEELEIYLQEKYKKSFNDIKIVLEYKGNDASYYKVFTEFIFVANSLLASKEKQPSSFVLV